MKKINCPNLAKNLLVLLILSLVFAVLFSGSIYALSSDNINLQGKIVRNDIGHEGMNVIPGSPACVVNGPSNDTCDFRVSYYTALTGGTLLLTEDFTNVEIGQFDGVFELSLGSGTVTTTLQCRDGTCNSPSEVISEYGDLYVELQFAPDGSTLTETFTRMPLEASPYAIFSKFAEGAHDAFKLSTSVSNESLENPSAGMIYFDTGSSQLKVYNGAEWQALSAGTSSSLWTDAGTYSYLTSTTDDLVLGGSTFNTGRFVFDMDGGSGSYFDIFNNDHSNKLFTILNSGNVGIGTATPGAKLEVGGDASTITNSTGNLTISTGGGNGNILLMPNGTGKVGIGTSSPTVALDVIGDIKASGVIRNVTVSGTTSTAAATAAKVVSIPNYTLTTGDLLSITFTNGNSVSNPTLNVNSTGAKNIRIGNTNASTTTMTISAGATLLLYYDGTYFQMMGSQRTSDSNLYDRTYWGNAITAGATIYSYKLVMQSTDGKWYPLTLESGTGTTKTVSTQPFVINSPILYYATTTTVSPNTTFSNVYSEVPTTYLNYTANQGTWTSQLPIYLKGVINSSGNFVLDNTSYTSFLTQSLPTSEDGFVYILLGQMYSTTGIRLFQYHPIYEYKNGRVQPYNPSHTHNWGSILNADGVYMDYRPSNIACSSDQILKYDSINSRWICADDNAGTGDNWGSQVVITNSTLTGNGTSGSPLGIALSNANTWTGMQTFRGLTVDSATATDDRIITSITTGGSARYDGTLTNADLTAARTWTLPNATGTIALGTGTTSQLAYWTSTNTLESLDYSGWDTNASDDVTTFLGLTDTPGSYSGSGNYLVRVNSAETALEFVEASAFTDTDNYVDSVDFNAGNGVLTLGRTGALSDLTTSLDGRYLPTGTDNWVNTTGDTMTGTLTFSGVSSDITTVNNEHLSLMPNGTGNVGIGTTNPTEKLEVNGTIRVDDPATGIIADLSLTRPYYGRLNYAVTPNNGKSEVRFVSKGATSGTGQTYFVVASTEIGDTGNNLLMGVASGRTFITNALNYSTAGTLHIGGVSWAGDGVVQVSGVPTDATGKMTVMGNVGIGTTSPAQKLDVLGGIRLGTTSNVNNVLDTQAQSGAPSGSLYWGNSPLLTSANLGTFGVASISNSDGTLTISPTVGNVIASLNLSNANTWTGMQTFRGLTVDSATATDDRIITSITTGGSARYDGTLTNADLTLARTWTLPDKSGTVAMTSDIPVSDNYQYWVLQANGAAGSNITSMLPVSFNGSGIVTTSRSGNTITITGTEADTLASVTGRGASTTVASLFTGGATIRGLIVDSATATDDRILTSITTGGSARYDGTLTNVDLTAARTWTLPNATGTIALGTGTTSQLAYWTSTNTLGSLDYSGWDTNVSDDVTNFLGLTDTPGSYSGSGNYLVRVNSTATALEFVEASAFTDTDNYVDSVDFNAVNGVLTLGRTGALSDLTTSLDGRYALSSAGMPTGTEGQMLYNNAGVWTSFSGMYWDDTNNRLGIGTTSPTQKLEVAGNVYMNDGYLMQDDIWGMKWQFAGTSDTVEMNQAETAWKFNVAGGGVTKYRFNSTKSGSINGPILDLELGGNAIFYGKEGIGVTSPTAVLHLKAGTATASTAPLKFTAGVNLTTPESGAMEWDGSRLYITNSTPTRNTLAYLSDLSSFITQGYQTIQEEGTALTQRSILNFIGSGITATDDGTNSKTDITLNSKLNTFADLTSASGVLTNDGSGTLSWVDLNRGDELLPTGTEGQMLYNNAGVWTAFSGMYWDDTNSRLGIGTTTPNNKIQIIDLVNFDNNKSSTYLGEVAGKFGAGGSNITAIGTRAGYIGSGDNLTAVGRDAGYNNKGTDSSLIGYQAGRNEGGVTYGNRLTAMGSRAGYNNQGNDVVALGYFAGSANTGSNSVFIGSNQGLNNTTENRLMIGNNSTISLLDGIMTSSESTSNLTINGRVGIATYSPTAYLHLKAGTATTNTAPLKFTAGTNLTTPESGAMEWDGSRLYITNSTPTRNTIAYMSDLSSFITQGYQTIQEEGTSLTQRSILNFVGSGILAADDSTNSRTNVSLDSDLNALANLSTTGVVSRTGADTFSTSSSTAGYVAYWSSANTLSGEQYLSVTRGGTGTGSFTSNQFLWYNGTSIVASGYNQSSFASSSHSHNWSQIANGSGIYMDYRPNNTACGADQILKYDTTNSRWICADDDAGSGDGWGSQVVITNSTLVGDGTSGTPLGIALNNGNIWGARQTFSVDIQTPLIFGLPTLSLRPSIDSDTAIQLQDASGNPILNVKTSAPEEEDDNRVGIGAIGTLGKLHVYTSSSYTNTAIYASQSYTSGTLYSVYAIANGTGATTNIGGYFSATGGTNNYGLLVANGNVGIGTTSPSSKLVVNTGGYSTIKLQYNGTSVVDIFSNVSSNIFIGLDSGSAITSGTGNVALGDNALSATTLGTSNTAIGYFALDSNVAKQGSTAIGYQAMMYAHNTTTQGLSYNTAVGYQALVGSPAPSSNTGMYNTVVGHQSMTTNTSGSYNSALGVNTLINNTIGQYNVAVGYGALFTNVAKNASIAIGYEAMRYADNTTTTGTSGNIAVGYQALMGSTTASNNTGTHNIAVGYQSLYGNTSGYDNVSIGSYAGNANTTGMQNVAVGRDAFRSNVAKSNNVAVGYGAMLYAYSSASAGNSYNTALGSYALRGSTTASNNSGTYNTSIGGLSGYSMTSGSNNALLGYYTGYAITTGSNNSLFGYSAGSNLTTGSNNIIIGANINADFATGSNQLNIGGAIKGDLSTGDVSITRNLGINGVAYTWPSTQGSGLLTNNGSGGLSWSTSAGLGLVSGTGSAGQVSYWSGTNSITGSNSFWWDATNNRLGIGTNTPQASIDIAGSTSSAISNTTGDITISPAGDFVVTSNTKILGNLNIKGVPYIWPSTQGSGLLTNNGSGGLSWATSAGLGLVSGTGSAGQVSYWSGTNSITGSNSFWWDATNNRLGIGTNTPQASIDIAGSTSIISNVTGNITISPASLILSINGRVYQTGLGYSTYFGQYAGRVDDLSDRYNTGIGYSSLYNNSTGTKNAALGYYSLYTNSTGANNTALGYYSLYSNTGSYNTAVGSNALRTNTSASYNTAVGYYSLYTNSTGTYNTALGYYSLYSNTGSYNSSLGSYSLYSNSSGTNNTSLGYYSLYSNTTGNYNVALGYQAGRYQADGSTALTDPENSIYIGYNAKGKDNNDNNSIVIGYNAVGIGANTVVLGNDSIVTTALKGKVGIGTISPSAALTLYGTNADFLLKSAGADIGDIIFQESDGNQKARIWTATDSGTSGEFLLLSSGDTTPDLTIDSNGYVGIGTTTPAYRLQLPNTADNAGKGQANAWVTYSDRSLKENIQTISGGLDKIMALRGVTFVWKGQGVASSGFIAQEVEPIIPDLVSTDSNGLKSLDYGRFTPYLVEAIKEQQLEIQSAYNRITQLENINSNKVVSITTPGWYRISKLEGNDDHSNIKINNTSIGSSQNIVLSIDSTLNNQNINIVSNLTTGGYDITKARINNENGIKYLEIYIPEVNENKINVKITESSNWITTDIVQITEEVNNTQEYALSGILFGISDKLEVEEDNVKIAGDLLSLSVNSSIGDSANRWNDIYAKGTIRLGSGADGEGAIRFNVQTKTLEFSNNGVEWLSVGDLSSQMTISPEYAGAILFADGSNNAGIMTSDAVEQNGTFKNYYEWVSEKDTPQDYDILVRITLPADFSSWKNDAVYLDFMTENSASTDNNSVNLSLIGNSGVDVQVNGGISKMPGAWERMSIKGADISQCNRAGSTCTLRISLTSSMSYFTRVGDITLNYNRSL